MQTFGMFFAPPGKTNVLHKSTKHSVISPQSQCYHSTRRSLFGATQSQNTATQHPAKWVAQLHTGHSPLLADYLYQTGRQDSATCPHCNDANETAEHLVLHCLVHDQGRKNTWPKGQFNTGPWCLEDFLEKIGAMTHPHDCEWERKTKAKNLEKRQG